MNISLIGYGKMGKEVENVLLQRGHNVINKYDANDNLNDIPISSEVCIDFTSPEAFKKNYKILAEKFAGVIVGTTGWNDIEETVFSFFKEKRKNFVYGSNFSTGVNVFFSIIEKVSKSLYELENYDPYILELHHNEKKDSPSGTAKTIQNIITDIFGKNIDVAAIRCGQIKGIHEVGFESSIDTIKLKHEAYSREGFALGSVLAAEWLEDLGGVWNFREMIKIKLNL